MKWNSKTRRAFALSSIALAALALSSRSTVSAAEQPITKPDGKPANISEPLKAQDALPRTAETFEIGGHKAFVDAALMPAQGKPWLWYAPTLGSLSPDEREAYYEAFLKAGISIAGFDLGEVRGSPASTAKFTLFYNEMVKRGYSPKPILLGQSRGGMMTLAWAFRNPDKVRAWVGIYPVCNLAGWSLQSSKAETLADFAMTEPELVAKLAEFNPIDNLEGLLANKVPMFAVHGDTDDVVPYDLNTKLLKEHYQAGGGSIQVKVIPGIGHQVDPAFFACQELVDFVLRHAKQPQAAMAQAAGVASAPLDACNVVWDSPSQDAHGSMPLGNGDVGINAWVEPTGDLVFYVSKTDAWDENGRLCKIGRVRVKFDPPLPVKELFRQELKLREGVIAIIGGTSRLELWVDANQSVVRLEATSETPISCRAEVELWRLRERPFGDEDDSHSGRGLSGQAFEPTVLPDVVMTSAAPAVVWYHRNTRSVYGLSLQVQHLETLKERFPDPLLDLTFGARLDGSGFVRDGARAIRSAKPSRRHELAVTALTAKGDWLAQLDRLKPAPNREAHERWWREFWDRSWIFVDGSRSLAMPVNNHPWRVGVDSDGESRFRGEIASAQVHGGAGVPPVTDRPTGGTPAPLPAADVVFKDGVTVQAWIKPAAGEAGRVLDKCTAGHPDGITFDTHPGLSLRWIVGDRTMIHPSCLKADEWQHVAATADPASGLRRIYLNGKLVKEERGEEVREPLTRGYVLQRFMNACSGRGGSPIKFNGSIFTVEAKPGASPETPDGDPDWRQWGGNYWFQNTRLVYWPMLAAGDYDLMDAWFRMYRDALPLSKARIETYYIFKNAAQFPETMYLWGLPNNADYGWDNTAPEPANTYIRWYWNGSLELIAVMLDRYDFTQDKQFARDTLVPLADPLIAFLDQFWQKRDANGKIRFKPAQSLETFHNAVNPLPEIAGLRFLLPRLLALPESVTTQEQRARWQRLLGELPPIPVADNLLRPAESFSDNSNSENPELYAVFPYRLFGVGRSDLDMARATYHARGHRHNRCWCQDSIQAACLGLGDEAGRLVSSRASQINRDFRFPVMWGPNFDWIPDQDHGNNILTTLQYMLMQSDGDKIFLLPAWPKDWNVSFKLHAPGQTVVECELRAGKIEKLEVTPESRKQDIVILKTQTLNINSPTKP